MLWFGIPVGHEILNLDGEIYDGVLYEYFVTFL
jgi:hypothetical protein